MKLRIRIVGPKVHDVGYRSILFGGAMSLRLSGFDANDLAEGNNQFVDIVVEGKEDQIKAYRTFIETHKPPDVEVSGIAVSDYDGDVVKIAEYAQVLTAMQMLKAIPTMMKIEQNTNVILENTKPIPQIVSNTNAILENTKPISQIVSNTNAILENTKPIHQIVSNTGAILDEVKGLREDIQPALHRDSSRSRPM